MLFSPPHQALQIKKTNWQNKMHKLFKPQGNPGTQIRFEMTLVPLKLLAAVKLRRQRGLRCSRQSAPPRQRQAPPRKASGVPTDSPALEQVQEQGRRRHLPKTQLQHQRGCGLSGQGRGQLSLPLGQHSHSPPPGPGTASAYSPSSTLLVTKTHPTEACALSAPGSRRDW